MKHKKWHRKWSGNLVVELHDIQQAATSIRGLAHLRQIMGTLAAGGYQVKIASTDEAMPNP